ncbi:hypothetical protein RJ639_001813 [Escallonia herrerae]|uniref:BHLH domain-containing protein n=1 Tax=Escallonia herrerae TaxID=1293975 RepID=A0AA88X8Q5_9ASTE|nr:hypothetical protein RJ639_001813 [Escallonia herrerae]
MAKNCFCSATWSEEAAWSQCQAVVDKDTSFLVPWLPASNDSTLLQVNGYPPVPDPSWSVPFEGGATDVRAASSSQSHSQAEKRRRDRINSQLATLRKLIPKSDKILVVSAIVDSDSHSMLSLSYWTFSTLKGPMDKAALLGSVVEHVNDLKRKALEVSKLFTIPTDVDEVTVDCDFDSDSSSSSTNDSRKSKDNIFIKASVCCDDRPELFAELNRALKGLRLTTVQADMTSLGGRVKVIFVLCTKANDGVGMNTLKQSLKLVLSRIVTSSSTATNYRIRSKRQRFFFPSSCSQ